MVINYFKTEEFAMEELLQQLVENELLTEDTKKELTEAITKQNNELLEARIVEHKAEVEAQVRVELQEQYQADKEALIEAIDTKVEEHLKEELDELRDDIERFRDLEVEYAEKLSEAKEELSEVLKGDIEELVETIDTFLDMRLAEEVKELKEDIDNVKRLQFGAEIFEAFEGMFAKKFVDENGLEKDLTEKENRLSELSAKLDEASNELKVIKREKKLAEVLEPLHGRSREVMEAVLKNIATEKLTEAYDHYIPKVLHESTSVVVESEKEPAEKSEVLAEGDAVDTKPVKGKVITEGTVVATGDTEQLIEESVEIENELPENVKQQLARLKHLGGFNSQ
jgi:DNA repair exonuclease SbcCD ATPase subunit